MVVQLMTRFKLLQYYHLLRGRKSSFCLLRLPVPPEKSVNTKSAPIISFLVNLTKAKLCTIFTSGACFFTWSDSDPAVKLI